jgi:hypothetical protein
MAPEELDDIELGCVVRHEPTGMFFVVIDKSDKYPKAVNSQTLFNPADWKLVRRPGEIVEGWDELCA